MRETGQVKRAQQELSAQRFEQAFRKAITRVRQLSASGRAPSIVPFAAYALLIAVASLNPTPAFAAEALVQGEAGGAASATCFALASAIGSTAFLVLGCRYRAAYHRRRRRWRHR